MKICILEDNLGLGEDDAFKKGRLRLLPLSLIALTQSSSSTKKIKWVNLSGKKYVRL